MHVADRQLDLDRRAVSRAPRLRVVDQLVIERLRRGRDPASCTQRRATREGIWRIVEDRGEIEPLRLPVVDRLARVEHVHAADHLVQRAEAQLRHVLAHLLRDEEEEIDDVLGLTL